MTNNEIIKKLFISFANKDEDTFYHLAEEYIKLEERKKHRLVVKELKQALFSGSSAIGNNRKVRTDRPIPRDNENGFPLIEIKDYDEAWESLIINDSTKSVINQVIKEFRSMDVLATYNLNPKNKMLFYGLPGTGKTFACQVISSVLQLPLIRVKFDAIVSSYLGETATNLRKVFDYISEGVWVVLFDEVDIIGKNRDDHYEHGEIKRVVNNFLQMLDEFEGSSLIICATNHQHILDPAIWRRFDEVIEFPLPEEQERLIILGSYLKSFPKNKFDLKPFAKKSNGLSPSDLQKMCLEAMRHSIVNESNKLSAKDLTYALGRFNKRLEIMKYNT